MESNKEVKIYIGPGEIGITDGEGQVLTLVWAGSVSTYTVGNSTITGQRLIDMFRDIQDKATAFDLTKQPQEKQASTIEAALVSAILNRSVKLEVTDPGK